MRNAYLLAIAPTSSTTVSYTHLDVYKRQAERGLIDEVIMPRDTRYKLIQALEMCHNKNQSNPPKKHGNMPL